VFQFREDGFTALVVCLDLLTLRCIPTLLVTERGVYAAST